MRSPIAPRPLERGDFGQVLALNAGSESVVSPMDLSKLEWFALNALRVVVVDAPPRGDIVAFTVVLAPRAGYASPNYRWFEERYETFAYLDRIVVAEGHRRSGIGTALYDQMELEAAVFGRLCCEVDVVPPNHPSLAFHESRGYREVGTLSHPGGKSTRMLELVVAGSPTRPL